MTAKQVKYDEKGRSGMIASRSDMTENRALRKGKSGMTVKQVKHDESVL